MKRVITISYTVDGPGAKSIGRYADGADLSRLVYKGLQGVFVAGELFTVEDVTIANEPVGDCPAHDAFNAAGLEMMLRRRGG